MLFLLTCFIFFNFYFHKQQIYYDRLDSDPKKEVIIDLREYNPLMLSQEVVTWWPIEKRLNVCILYVKFLYIHVFFDESMLF